MAEKLTTSGAARLLRCSEATVRLWALNGRLPHEKTASGLRIFAREDVERLASQLSGRRSQ